MGVGDFLYLMFLIAGLCLTVTISIRSFRRNLGEFRNNKTSPYVGEITSTKTSYSGKSNSRYNKISSDISPSYKGSRKRRIAAKIIRVARKNKYTSSWVRYSKSKRRVTLFSPFSTNQTSTGIKRRVKSYGGSFKKVWSRSSGNKYNLTEVKRHGLMTFSRSLKSGKLIIRRYYQGFGRWRPKRKLSSVYTSIQRRHNARKNKLAKSTISKPKSPPKLKLTKPKSYKPKSSPKIKISKPKSYKPKAPPKLKLAKPKPYRSTRKRK